MTKLKADNKNKHPTSKLNVTKTNITPLNSASKESNIKIKYNKKIKHDNPVSGSGDYISTKKNKICMILPCIGNVHSFFNLFLHSVYKNRNILDLIILIPDNTTPDLIPKFNFILPENVSIKEINLHKISKILEKKLTKIFELSANTLKQSIDFVHNPHSLQYFKCFYNLLCQDVVMQYSHWGWCGRDLILGDILSFYSDILEYDCIASTGQFGVLRNKEILDKAYKPDCEFSAQLYAEVYENFVVSKNKEYNINDRWGIRVITRYLQKLKNKKCLDDRLFMSNTITLLRSKDKFETNNKFNIDFFEYRDGKVYSNISDKQTELLYIHFMERSELCINEIKTTNYLKELNFKVHTPLTFIKF